MNTYFVKLNWHGELHSFYTNAPTAGKALANAINRLGKQLKVSGHSIRIHVTKGDRSQVKLAET